MRKLVLFILNNIVTNQFLILIGKDHIIKKYKANWSKVKYDNKRTLQENVGFSHEPEVTEAIEKVHRHVQHHCQIHQPKSVLDIGCGTGLYLKDFSADIVKYGTDLSADFISQAKNVVPDGFFLVGDFITLNLPQRVDFVFSISVLEYVPPSKLSRFFEKIAGDLSENGVVLIQYPHATRSYELWYPDLSYVQYSPHLIEQKAGIFFDILDHFHSYDDRKMNIRFDSTRYDRNKEKSFRNGAIIVARKKR